MILRNDNLLARCAWESSACQTGRCLTQSHTSLRAEELSDALYVRALHHLINVSDILAVWTVKPLATLLFIIGDAFDAAKLLNTIVYLNQVIVS